MKFLLAITLLWCQTALADTPPPGFVQLKGGTNQTVIGNVSDSLKVSLTGGSGLTVNQGTGNGGSSPWSVFAQQAGSWSLGVTSLPANASFNLNQISGTAISASNALPTLTTFSGIAIDPRQIRPLIGSDVVTASQGGSWVVTANAGTGTFQTNVTNSSIPVTQSGTWTTGRTWSLLNTTDSVNVGNFPLFQLDTTGAKLNLAQGSTTAGQTGPLIQAAVTTSAPVYTTAQTSPLSLNISGGLRVDGSGVTQPISGSVSVSNFPASQVVSQSTASNLNAQVVGNSASGSADSGNPVKAGTVFNTTQPTVSSGSRIDAQGTSRGGLIVATGADTFHVTVDASSAPTGVATSANQTNGTQTTQINGGGNTATITASNALKVDGSAVTQPVSGTVTANQGSAAALSGKWPVQVTDGTNTMPTQDIAARAGFHKVTDGTNTAAVKAASTPASATDPALVVAVSPNNTVGVTQSTSPWVSNVSQFGGNAVVTGTGASGLGIPRFTVSNDSNILVTQSGTWTVQQGTPPWTVMGNAASGSADSGNPVKGGSVFNTTQPTVTTGQRVDLQGTARGGLIVATGTDSFNVNNVTGTISLPTGASTSANQTNGSQTTQINQGGNTAAVTASSALKVDGSAVTQPITGPVSQGTAAAISGRWPVQLTDGTNVSTVKAASTAAVAGDTSVVVAMSPNSPIPSGTNSIGSVRILDSAGMSITLGQKSAAASVPVVTQANEIPLTASITAQDTGSTSTSFANSQAFITGTPTAGSTASFSFSSFEAVEVQVTGVWTGTLMTEVSMDSGTTWFARGVKQSGLSYISNSFTANFEGGLNVAGITNFRVRSTAAWTGTATVAVVQSVNTASVIVSNPQMLRDGTTQSIVNTIKPASTAAVAADPALVVAVSPNNTVSVVGNVASGSADSGNPVKVGSVFNSTLPTPSSGQRVDLQGDKNGRLITLDVPSDGYKATYSASILGLSATTTPTDIFTITGSATKTVRVTRFVLTATQQTSATRDVQLIIRSTADSGGTSTTQTAVPYDSSSAAATATVLAYTANPTTLGTLVGAISARKMNILATNVTSAGDRWEENFGNRPSQAIVLRGTSQQLCVNLNSVTSSGNSFDIYVEWTEE